MDRRASWVAGILVAGCLAAIAGCNGKAKERETMLHFGLAIQNYMDLYKDGPENWDELLEYVRKSPESTDLKILEQVKAGGYVIDWQADHFAKFTSGREEYVYMYPTATATNGGQALMCNFIVKDVTADELKAILKKMADAKR